MYELKNKISNVSTYKVKRDNKFIAYKDTKGFKEKSIYVNNKKIEKSSITGFSFYNKYLYFSDWNKDVFKLNLDDFSIDYLNNYEQVSELSNEDFLILTKNTEKAIIFFKNKDIEISQQYITFKSLLTKEFLFSELQNKIQTYSLTTPQTPQWQFDLSQFGTFYSEQSQQQEAYKVEKFIGIHQDRLYVALNGGMLLEIDIATGELTHRWQNIMTTDRGFSYPVEPNTFTMDKQLGKMVSFYTSDFITIDLASKKVNITPLDEELNKFDGMTFRPTPDDYAIDATHIYTIVTLNAPEEDFIKQSIVAFNKQTKKIDWHYTDNQFSVDSSSPKIAGNKLYQKVNVSNLYIFEKTNDENV